jgi:hypothetical protein
VVQAAYLMRSRRGSSFLLCAGVDAIHAASMAGMAWLRPERRRPAALDAAAAMSFSLGSLAAAVRRRDP